MQENHENANAHINHTHSAHQTKSGHRSIYPELNPWLKNSLFWLGLIFVGVVFFLHNVSGYS